MFSESLSKNMERSNCNSRKNIQIQLDEFFYKNDLLLYCSNFKYFAGKRFAIIGSSPVSLIAGNIFAAYGGHVTIFEKSKGLGGAWSSIKMDKMYVPASTHIIMPNPLLFDLLKIFGVGILPWTVNPKLLNWTTKDLKPFPKAQNQSKIKFWHIKRIFNFLIIYFYYFLKLKKKFE